MSTAIHTVTNTIHNSQLQESHSVKSSEEQKGKPKVEQTSATQNDMAYTVNISKEGLVAFAHSKASQTGKAETNGDKSAAMKQPATEKAINIKGTESVNHNTKKTNSKKATSAELYTKPISELKRL